MQKRWKKGIRDALCTLTQGKSICVKWKLGLWKSVMVTKEWFKKTDFLKDAVCLNAHWDCSLYATVRIYHCPAGCVGLSCTYIWLSRVRTGNTYIILITKRTQKTTATRCLSGLFLVCRLRDWNEETTWVCGVSSWLWTVILLTNDLKVKL